MVALKKAYAEIILNTEKEAAARIIVSRRKAVLFEKDLNSSKNEALRLLVHLRQIIDSTTKEAEVTSLTQQRKIDELEAQLHEAEDVITDLRSELRQVRDKLEKVRNNQLQPLNGQIKNEDTYAHKNVTVEPAVRSILDSQLEAVTTSEMENNPLNLRILDNRSCSTAQQTENFSVTHLDDNDDHNPNLVSTTMRSKEPELCRNGFTHRLCALERNLLNGKLPLLGSIDGQCTLVKNQLTIETSDMVVGSTAPSPKTKNVDMAKNYSGREVKKPVKVRTSQRKKICFGKAKASICRSCPGQPRKPSSLSSVPSRCKSYLVKGHFRSEVSTHTPPSFKAGNMDNGKTCGELDEKLLHKRSFSDEEIKISQKQKKNMRVQSREATAASFRSPSQLTKPSQPSSCAVIYSFALRGSVKSSEGGLKTTENEAKMKPLPRLDPGLTLIRSGVDPVSGSKNVTVSIKVFDKSRIVQKTEEKDKELRDESVFGAKGDAVKNSMAVCSESTHEVVNVPVLSDLKDTKSSVDSDGSPSKPDFNRVLKYTFQRKRKKESMSNPGENTSPDNTIVKKRAAEKQNDVQEPESSPLINESSRDSWRMAQVACQLISLSGRRW